MISYKFIFSWGRKLFFGLSFPLGLLLGLIYLKSYIFPQNNVEWIFYVGSLIGQIGLINSILYFILFCPVVYLMPSYYLSRIWAIFLILVINLLILADALLMAEFHQHLYSNTFSFNLSQKLLLSFSTPVQLILLFTGILTLILIIWFKADVSWKRMQIRFSNPVSHWYLLLIFLGLIFNLISINSISLNHKFVTLLPLRHQDDGLLDYSKHRMRLYYPTSKIKCQNSIAPNIFIFLAQGWSVNQLNNVQMPLTSHMANHGLIFKNYLKIATSLEDSLFNLLYSLPTSYKPSINDISPAFYTLLKERDYVIKTMIPLNASIASTDVLKTFLEENKTTDKKPMFVIMKYQESFEQMDSLFQKTVKTIQEYGALKNSHILLTSLDSSSTLLPLVWIDQESKGREILSMSTPYDVLPALMKKIWNCKNPFSTTGIGEDIMTKNRDWVMTSGTRDLLIQDLKNNSSFLINSDGMMLSGMPRVELLHKGLKLRKKFYQPL